MFSAAVQYCKGHYKIRHCDCDCDWGPTYLSCWQRRSVPLLHLQNVFTSNVYTFAAEAVLRIFGGNAFLELNPITPEPLSESPKLKRLTGGGTANRPWKCH